MSRFLITRKKETGSTNADLKELARGGAPFGSVIVAERQQSGRGRMGRIFSSQSGGLYMSLLLPLKNPQDAGLLTTYAAVATARAIERLAPVKIKIKWVNDLYLGSKKLCGILAEGGAREDSYYAVLGIGVNLTGDLPDELSQIATTLLEACGQAVTPDELLREILTEFENFDSIAYSTNLDEYRHRCMILGKNIAVIPHNAPTYKAKALEVLDDGALLVEKSDGGEKIKIFSGEVSTRLTEAL